MENIDGEDGDVIALQMQEPLVHDSDNDTLKASQDSFNKFNWESDASTPVRLYLTTKKNAVLKKL